MSLLYTWAWASRLSGQVAAAQDVADLVDDQDRHIAVHLGGHQFLVGAPGEVLDDLAVDRGLEPA